MTGVSAYYIALSYRLTLENALRFSYSVVSFLSSSSWAGVPFSSGCATIFLLAAGLLLLLLHLLVILLIECKFLFCVMVMSMVMIFG